jgi:hypothetical protein
MRLPRAGYSIGGIIAAFTLIAATYAQPTPDVPAQAAPAQPDLPALTASLDSEDLPTRLSAALELREREDISLRQIETVLRAGGLSAEQHRRLTAVAWERFRSEPRPAMGVQTNQTQQRGTVLDFITPGFPAAQVLKPGDRIESVDGVRLDEFGMLRRVILSRDPGDEMTLVVFRDGAALNLKVKLGRYADLRNSTLDEPSLLMAFRQFRAKDYYQYNPDEPPIENGLPPEDWSFAELAVQQGDPAYADYGEADGSQSGMPVVAGGEPRAGIVMTPARPSRNFRAGPIDGRPGRDDFALLIQFQQQMQTEMQANLVRINDTRLPAETRAMLRAQNDLYAAEIKKIDDRIRQLRGR